MLMNYFLTFHQLHQIGKDIILKIVQIIECLSAVPSYEYEFLLVCHKTIQLSLK